MSNEMTPTQTKPWRMLVAFCMAVVLAGAALGAGAPAAFAVGEGDPQPAAEGQAEPQAAEDQQAPDAAGAGQAADAGDAEAADAAQGDAGKEGTSANAPSTKLDVDGITIGKDAFIADQDLASKDMQVAANLFASAQTLTLSGTEVGADAFAAGQTVTLTNVTAGNNLFIAGSNVTLSKVTGTTLFIGGNNLDIDADMDNLHAAGNTVFLKGTYESDVDVAAANVIVDPYITVKGTLNVTAEQEPTIASTAKVGSFNYNQSEDAESAFPASMAAIGSAVWLWSLLMMALGMVLLGIVLLLVLRTEVVDGAGRLVRERPLAVFVSGLITIIVLPLVIVGLFATGVCWTIALALLFGMVIITVFAGTYTAISVGRAVLRSVNKWVSSMIFIVVFALLFCLPIVDFVLGALCTLYFAGSVIQGWWVWRRAERDGGPDSRVGGEPDYSEFSVPRGTHVNPPVTEQAVAPIPASGNVPTRDSADYKPSDWS